MNNLNDYALAGYDGRQTDAMWSSSCWLAEQAGKVCKSHGITPIEVKQGRGYSIVINRVYVVKFNTKDLSFESITKKATK